MKNPELGRAEIDPKFAYAGKPGTWEIIFHPGIQCLDAGSRIRVYPPFTFDKSHNSCVRWELGNVTAFSAYTELKVDIINTLKTPFATKYHAKVIEVKIESGKLCAPEKLSIVIGNQLDNGEAARAQWLSGPDMPFHVAVALPEEEFIPLADYPEIRVYGAEAERLVVVAPSTVAVGEHFPVRIKAEDNLTNIADKLYRKPVNINKPDSVSGASGTVVMKKDCGQKKLAGFSINHPGIYRIKADDEELTAQSNPVAVEEFASGGNKVFWGEIHAHTELSDGVGSENRFYEYARDEAWLDFAAISEHRGGDQWWEACREAAEKYYQPGKFATLLGYETAWRLGHCNVYSRDLDLSVHSWDEHKKTLELIRQGKAILIPHHTNDPLVKTALFQWEDISPELIHAVEICQMRGSFEKDELGDHVLFGGFGKSIQDALRQGFRPGFTGGTDNHCGRAGSTMKVAFQAKKGCGSAETCDINKTYIDRTLSGLTAVFAPELTREAVFDAIRNRRCYATTGERILLDFQLNESFMGEEAEIDGPAQIRIKAAGTSPVEELCIIRNNEDVLKFSSKKMDVNISWEDPSPKSGNWYYVRVRQSNGHYAWSSPIWIN